MNSLLYLAEAILVAYLMRLAAIRLKIPTVSGYVLGGVILGGSFFFWHPGGRTFSEQWLFTRNVLAEMEIVTQIALGIIAISIGAELEWKVLKKLGKSVIYITLMGAFAPLLFITIAVFLIWRDFPLAIILGAVASATAPAATVAVIQQYKARGPLTSTIIAVVGLDDAVSFIVFAFSMTLVKGFLSDEGVDLAHGLLYPGGEVLVSLVIGAIFGLAAARLLMTAKDQESAVFILFLLILTVSGIAATLNVSELLANMAAGAIIVNVHPFLKKKIRLSFSSFTPVFYALFFILGGAHLDLSSIGSIWHISLVYFFMRALGKIPGPRLALYGDRRCPV